MYSISHITQDGWSRFRIAGPYFFATDNNYRYARSLMGVVLQSIGHDHKVRAVTEKLLQKESNWDPGTRKIAQRLVDEANDQEVPIMPVTDYEAIAYLGDRCELKCKRSGSIGSASFLDGATYGAVASEVAFKENRSTLKVGAKGARKHLITVEGMARVVRVNGVQFDERCKTPNMGVCPLLHLWDWFHRPTIPTVKERFPDLYAANMAALETLEQASGFRYFPGQKEYLPRIMCKDSALIGAECGCHAEGTPILMWNGDVRPVETVSVGDEICGWDGTPRKVLSLKRGRQQMARITPKKGEPFVVNMDHILTVVHVNMGEGTPAQPIKDVSVRDFLQRDKTFRRNHALFRNSVKHWAPSRQPIPPYILGVLLGDGHLGHNQVSVSNPDPEIQKEVVNYCNANGWPIRWATDNRCATMNINSRRKLVHLLENIGAYRKNAGDKFIPNEYKVASWQQRLEIVAGLIDTDGHLSRGGYDWISKSKQLAEDFTFICRSLGLAAYVKPCVKSCQNNFSGTYYRVSVSGDCSIIPCRVKRKIAPVRKQIKSVTRTAFKVDLLGEDNYFGFEITGDGRYMMGDFTVTHNSGKSLLAISTAVIKGADRVLIIAPQGTTKGEASAASADSTNCAQWVSELRRFTPFANVFELFSINDYKRIKKENKGILPKGFYVSYYQAMLQNGAMEVAPSGTTNATLRQMIDVPTLPYDSESAGEVMTIGEYRRGIRCIAKPSLLTLVGHEFDMGIVDEAHIAKNITGVMGSTLLGWCPRYRYALTTTPIPNNPVDLFGTVGWVAVPFWGSRIVRSYRWPYSRRSLGDFAKRFLCIEEDHTQSQLNQTNGKKRRYRKSIPVLSRSAELLRLLKPNLAYISKAQCNPFYQKPEIIQIHVAMGATQALLYNRCLLQNGVGRSALARASTLANTLRQVCCDPLHSKDNDGVVKSAFNPKLIGILEIVRDCLNRGEQFIIVNSRMAISGLLQGLLKECGVEVARIDSSVNPKHHSRESNRFKRGEVTGLIMGIKCAQAYSFSKCSNLIIGSMEWSNGTLEQAVGRIDRLDSNARAKVYCLLHPYTIEQRIFDVVSMKDDAASICLRGKAAERDYKGADMSSIVAQTILAGPYANGSVDEASIEKASWPALKADISMAIRKMADANAS